MTVLGHPVVQTLWLSHQTICRDSGMGGDDGDLSPPLFDVTLSAAHFSNIFWYFTVQQKYAETSKIIVSIETINKKLLMQHNEAETFKITHDYPCTQG